MVERFTPKEQLGNLLFTKAVRSNAGLFFDASVYDIQFLKSWSVRMIRDGSSSLQELPDNLVIHRADFNLYRKDNGIRLLGTASMMQSQEVLIPLGTHTTAREKKHKAYSLDLMKGTYSEHDLGEFILSGLSDTVTLTRVLSPAEISQYVGQGEGLGSSHRLFWNDKVFTALHNITDEFDGDGYETVIKFIFEREVLTHLYHLGGISFGTYKSIFSLREPDSPFPFDLEVVFNRGAMPLLVEAYVRWVTESGQTYLPNPFFRQKP